MSTQWHENKEFLMARKNLDDSKKRSKAKPKKDVQQREQKSDDAEFIDEKDEYDAYPDIPGKKYFQDDF